MEPGEAKRLGHDLVGLLDVSRLGDALEEEQDLHLAFSVINNSWAPEMRYSGKKIDERSSRNFLRDTKDLRNWLQTQSNS